MSILMVDTINTFEKSLRNFCGRNNIEMGVDIRPSQPSERKYVFVNSMEKLTKYCFEGFCIVVDFAEVEDLSETFELVIRELINRFELYVDTDSIYAIGLETKVKKPTMYITTARATGKSEIQRRLEERLSSEPLEFYTSPEWKKCMLNAMFGKYAYTDKEKEMKVKIEKVYFNAPYTIVIWSDKTKTMVKAENECYDEEKGLAMAICKKFLGTNNSKGNYFDEFKKWLPKEEKKVPIGKVKAVVTDPEGGISITVETPAILTPAQLAAITGQSVSTIRRECAQGLHPGAKLVKGRWQIPYNGMARR